VGKAAADGDRPDLAAMIVPLGRALMEAERPVLARFGLSMWGYVVLTALDRQHVRTQAALARAIRADKTRIIADLDELESRGLITRAPDPADRRVNLLSLTPAGRTLRRRTRAAIRVHEERLLGELPAAQRDQFVTALRQLADLPWGQLTGESA
jgi:DNA-binding MarR family transcriptional regulator